MGFNYLAYNPVLALFSDNQSPKKAGGAAATANNDAVDQWNDVSGNNNHVAYQSGTRATYQLAQLNGLPVVRFGGAASAAIYRTVNQLTYGPFTAFCVRKSTTSATFNFERSSAANTNAGEWLQNNAITLAVRRGTTLSGLQGASGWINDSAWHLISAAYGGTLSRSHVWVDGALQGLTIWVGADSGAADATDYVYVGNRQAGGYAFAGDMAALLIYPSYLTISQWLLVYSALAAKYGISGGPAPFIIRR